METKEAQGIRELLALANGYAAARGYALSTVGKQAAGDARFFERLRDGDASWTARKYDQVVGWFSVNWPDGTEWPDEVPRPAPEAA